MEYNGRVYIPRTSIPLKNLLITNFGFIVTNWELYAPPQENSPNVRQRMYWLRLKHIIQELVHQLRLIQTRQERQQTHQISQYDSVEIMYQKLTDLWTNHMKVETLDIPEGHTRWTKICVLIFEILNVQNYIRYNHEFRGD